MTDSIPLSQLEPSPSLSFNQIGDKHVGTIMSFEQRQQTDAATGAPKTFPDGSPMMLWVITLELPDGDTGALWAKGGRFKIVTGSGESMLNAIGTAVKAADATSLDVGGQLAVAFTGEGEAKTTTFNKAKLYTAQYKPPAPQAASVPVADLFS